MSKYFQAINKNIVFKFLLLVSTSIFLSTHSFSQSFSRATGNWDNSPTALWATTAGGVATKNVPVAGDAVTVQNGNIITVSGTYTCNSLTINAGGSLVFSAGASLTVTGGVTINGTLDMTAGGTINLSGNFSNNGTFTSGAGTIVFNGNNQNVSGTTYNNVTFQTGNTKTLTGSVIINGTLTTSQNISLANSFNLTLNGTVTRSGGVLTNTTGTTITYNSSSAQQIIPSAYTNLTLQGAGTKSLIAGNNYTVSGTFSMASDLSCGTSNLTLNGTVTYSSGALTTGANTVTYGGAAAQSVIAATYIGGLTLSGGGAKTMLGAVSVNGAFSLAATNALDCSGFDLTLIGATTTGGTLTTGTNTVTYNALAAQNIFGTTYNNLTLGGNNTKTLTSATTINGSLTVGASSTLQLATFDITSNQTTSVSGTINDNSGTGTNIFVGAFTVNLGGTFSTNTSFIFRGGITNNGTFSLTGGTATFNTNSQSLAGNSAMTFSNILINGITLTNSNTNTVNVSGTIDGTGVSSIFDNSTNATLSYTNTSVLFSGGGSLVASANPNTVNYALNGTQTIFNTTYHNLIASAGGTKTIVNNLTVNGNLTVSAGTLDLGTVATTVTITGNAAIVGTLTFNGTTTKSVSITGDLSGAGTINISGGSLLHTLSLGGANNAIGTFTTAAVASTVNYNRAGNQSIFSSANYRVLSFGGSGTKSIQGTTSINGDITIPSGVTLALNANILNTSGNITINNGGTLDVNALATLTVSNTRVVTNNGTMNVIGTSGNLATVTRNTSGTFSITQSDPAAVFAAQHYTFSYLNNGITISNGSIDASNNFSNGTFSLGTGSQYLNLTGLNFSDFTVSNTAFGSGPTSNVSRTSGTGTITFEDATGALSGEVFDNDNGNPGTLINWSNPVATYYSQGTDNFSTLSNWNKNAGGGGANPTASDLTNGLSTFIIQNGHNITLDQNIDVLELRIGGGTSGSLVIGNNTTNRTLIARQDLRVNAGASLTVGAFDASHTLDIRGNVTNNGTFNLRNSFTQFANTSFAGTNTQIFGTISPTFYNITFAASSNTTANVALTVTGGVTLLASSVFQDGGLTHTVSGDWTDGTTGTMTGTGTIQFNGNSQSIVSASTFNNITFNGSAPALTLAGAVTATGNVLVTNNTTVFANTNVIHLFAGNFTVNSGSAFTQTNGTVEFNGTAAQTIDAANATFTNITFTNGGALNPKTILNNLTATGNTIINTSASVGGTGIITLANLRQEGVCTFSNQINFTGGTINNNAALPLGLGTANITCTAGTTNIQASNTVTSGGNFTVNNGALFVLNNNSSLTGSSGTFTLNAGANLYMRGVNNFPSGYGTYSLSATSTSLYDASFAQTVRGGLIYGNLTLTNNFSKTVDGALDINGALNLNNNVIADFNGFSHTIAGSVTTNASFTLTNNQTITFDNPNADQTLAAGTYNLNNLFFTNTAPTAIRTKTISASSMALTGSFSATNTGGDAALLLVIETTSNTITGLPANSFTLGSNVRLNTNGASSFSTSVSSFGTVSLDANSTVRFNNTTPSTNQTIPTGFSYGNIEIQGPGNAVPPNTNNKTASGALDINGSISSVAGNGFLVDGGFAHTIAGNWNLTSANYPSPTSNFTLDGADQTIGPANSDLNFFNIVFAGTGTKTFATTNNGSTMTVLNDLTVSDGITVDINSKNIAIRGNWINTGTGIFTQDATTTFNGTTANQTVSMSSASLFGNLTINKSNVSFQTLTANSNLQISRNLTLTTNNAVFAANTRTISIGDDFNYNTGSSFSTSGTFVFNGNTFAQGLNMNTTGATFNNLSFSGNQVKTLNTNSITVNGDLSIAGSTTFNGNNQAITVLGNWLNSGTFQHASTVNFTGGNQSISSSSFNSVNFAGTNTKTLAGNISLGANLTIGATATLDVTASNHSISVDGGWTNNGTFLPNTGTVTFAGNNKTVITGGTGAGKRFYNLTLAMAAGQAATLSTNALDVANNLTINTGTLTTGANSVSVGGNMIVNDTYNQNNNASILTFTSTSGPVTFNPGNSPSSVYRAITINGGTGVTFNLSTNNLTINNNQALNITSGIFKLNGRILTMTNGNIVVSANGTLDIDAGAFVYLANGASITNTGVLRIVGNSTSVATILRNGGSAGQGYTITQTSGTIHASYYSIQNTVGAGITISGGTIDATNNFSNGSFSSGAGTQYLLLSGLTFTDFSVDNVTFNAGPTNNVTRLSGSGIITFNLASGAISGAGFENDSPDGSSTTGFIRWQNLGKKWSNATADNNWNTGGNWSPIGVPTNAEVVYLDHTIIPIGTAYTVNITTANADCQKLFIDNEGGSAISLVLNNGFDLTVAENVDIKTGNTVTVTNNTNIINVGSSWSNAGTFNNGSSTINFNGVGGGNSITPGASAFFNINVNNGGYYSFTSATTISGSVNVSNGTLDVGSSANTLSVGGDWTNGGLGVFVPQSGLVSFNGSGSQTIIGGPFYDFSTATGGTKQVNSTLTVARNLTIGASTTLNAGSNIIFVRGTWANNSSSAAFVQTGSGAVFFDGAAQTIDNGSASTSFNNLTFAGTVNNTKTLARSITASGDVLISSSAVITVNSQGFTITGTPSKSFTIAGTSVLTLQGANNFPSAFGTYSLASGSTVNYQFNAAQSIFSTTYGNLTLSTLAPTALNTKTALGHIIVQGNLTINDVNLQLDMNNFDMTLAGNLAFPASGRQILWGTGMFTHNGAGWNIDVDYTGFSPDFGNVTLSGSGVKAMLANLNIGGDFSVQSGVTLTMNTFTLTSTGASKAFTLANGATLNCNVVAPEQAFPKNFTVNTTNANSTVNLNGASSQIVFTGVTYGILNLSNNAVNNTLSGTLNVAGNFSSRASTLLDAGFNMNFAGSLVILRNYNPTVGTTVTLNGSTQNIYDDNNGDNLDLTNLVFSNTNTKVLGSNVGGGIGNVVNISGTVSIASGVTVNTTRNVFFSGSSWTNSGSFNHTANTFTFSGTGAQNINPGTSNSYNQVAFTNTGGTISFASNGGVFANTGAASFIINTGVTVNMGSGLTHSIAGTVTNSGTWTTDNANFIFNGGGLTVTTPVFVAQNVSTSGTGTKIMGCNWSVNNLTIGANTALQTTAAFSYGITVRGNWTNSGTFNANSSTVAFESDNTSDRTITAGNSAFNNVTFNQSLTAVRNYKLLSLTTTFSNTLTIGSGATLQLNSNTLNLGSNNGSVETHTVSAGGTLFADANSSLRFNNVDGTSTFNVAGTLKMIGTSGNVATVTRATAAGRTNINITGTIEANYYLIEFLSDAGMQIASGATVNTTNNLSNGTWSNIATAGGTPKYYLVLEAAVTNPITNVTFNFAGMPTTGVHFNVQRSISAVGTVTFAEPISGVLGSFQYESDPTGPSSPSATTGKCLWPVTVVVTWTGAVNRNWNLADNWSPATIPTATIDAIIPNVANDPLITSANADCRNLTINGGILGIDNGFDLSIFKDLLISTTTGAQINVLNATSDIVVGGAWTNNLGVGSFNSGSAKVTFTGAAGAYTINPGLSPFFNLDFNGTTSNFFLNGATLNVNGSMNILAGTVYPLTSGYNLSVKGDFNNSGGYFEPLTTGTLTLNGTTAQNITNVSLRNLVVSGTGVKTFFATDTIFGTTVVNNGATLVSGTGNTLHLQGNVTINTGGSFDDGSNLHFFRGANWTGTGDWVVNTGTIQFDFGGGQTITGGKFNNLVLAGSGTKTLAGNVSLNADFTLKASTAGMNCSTFLLSSASGLSVFNMESTTTMNISGANNCPSNFATYNVDANTTTNYNAAFDQTVGGITYGNLNLVNTTAKTLSGEITVLGNLTINTATFDVSTSNYNINLYGNFNNNSTGSFIARNGSVTMLGATNNEIFLGGASGTKTFYDIVLNKSVGSAITYTNRDTDILNDLLVSSGSFNNRGFVTTVSNNILATSGSIATNGTYTMNKASGTANLQTNNSTLFNLTINGGATFLLLDNITLNGNFNLISGTFNGNSQTANFGNGSDNTTIAGTYIIGAGGKLGLGNNSTCVVTSTGTLEVVGTSGNIAQVTRNNSGGTYNFNVDGTIKARFYQFEYMSTSGIQINTSATIDPTDNFSDGTFTNGANGGTLLKIENGQTLTIDNVSFPSVPGGSGPVNVAKTIGTSGVITFNLATGVFSGAAYENDPFSLINWVGPITLTWNGSTSANWFTASNWTASSGPAIVPTGAEDVVVVAAGIFLPEITQDGAKTKKLTINSGVLTLNSPASPLQDMYINGDLQINNGTFQITGTNDSLFVAGNWNKGASGTFTPGTSTVFFKSPSGTVSINNGTSQFNSVVIDSTAIFQLGAASTLNGNLSIRQGSLDVTATNYALTVRGNWENNATFLSRTGTVTLAANSAGARTINSGTSAFNVLTINPSASNTYQIISNNLTTNSNLNLQAGTLDLNGLVCTVGDDAGSDNLTITGTLDVDANASLKIGNNGSVIVNSGGNLRIVGNSWSEIANLGNISGSNKYSVLINSGGGINARYYNIEHLGVTGLVVNNGATINATNNFSKGTFSDGASGGKYLDIKNSFVDFTADSVTFNSGPSRNCSRTSGSGVITFHDSRGGLSGFNFEEDDNNPSTGLVRWTYTFPFTNWTGNTSTDWNDASNWDNGVPSASFTANIPDVSAGSNRYPVLNSGSDGNTRDMNIYSPATFTLGGNRNLTILGALTTSVGSNFVISSGSSSTVTVGDIWSVAGAFSSGNASTVVLNPTSGVKSITQTGSFYNLTLAPASGATVRTNSSLIITNNININSGTFSVNNSSHEITVGNNWSKNALATFSPSTGKVVFNKNGTQSISGTGNTFYDIDLINNSNINLSNSIDINRNLTLATNCQLNAGTSNISIKGNWTNNGKIFIPGTGTVTFSGTTNQSILRNATDGELFNNITVNSTATVTCSRLVTANGVVTLTAGTLASAGNFVLRFNTGGAIASTGTGSLSGQMATKRLFNLPSGGWHYFGSALQGSTIGDIAADFTFTNSNWYFYREAKGDLYIQAGWVRILPLGLPNTTLLSSQRTVGGPSTMVGYAYRFSNGTNKDMTLRGTYNHAAASYTTGLMSHTVYGQSWGEGWQLISNPYPSHIDWNSVTISNIDPTITYYNRSLGVNATYLRGTFPFPGVSTNGGTQYIPPMQAFWVQTLPGGGSVTIPKSSRVVNPTGAPNFYRETNSAIRSLKLAVKNDKCSDEVVVRFGEGATEKYDRSFDAYKFENDRGCPNLYFTVDTAMLAVNSLPMFNEEKVIPLNFEVFNAGTLSIDIQDMINIKDLKAVYLHDKITNTTQNLLENSNYQFTASKGDTKNRFELNFVPTNDPVALSDGEELSKYLNIFSNQNKINLELSKNLGDRADIWVTNTLGQTLYIGKNTNIRSGKASINMGKINTGVYVVKVEIQGRVFSKEVLLESVDSID